MSTGTSYHFGHMLQVSKNLFEVGFYIYIFFMILYIYIARGRGRQPPGDKVLMSTEKSYHFIHSCLSSLILYNFFHDLIHVYSPGAGTDSP